LAKALHQSLNAFSFWRCHEKRKRSAPCILVETTTFPTLLYVIYLNIWLWK